MPKSFESLEEAEAYLKHAIDNILNNDIANMVRKTEASTAQSVVYDAYAPIAYKRRNSITDLGNIEASRAGDLAVFISNQAFPSDYTNPVWFAKNRKSATTNKNLPEVIENGAGYDFTEMEPRPFTHATAEKIRENGELSKVMAAGLRRYGIVVGRG